MTNDNWLSDEQERIENERAVRREMDCRGREINHYWNLLVACVVVTSGVALWLVAMAIILVLHPQ